MNACGARVHVQLAHSPGDVSAFKRAVNVPRRGVGPQTAAAIVAFADSERVDVSSACERIAKGSAAKGLSTAAWKAVVPFANAMRTFRAACADGSVSIAAAVEKLLTDIKFTEYVQVREV